MVLNYILFFCKLKNNIKKHEVNENKNLNRQNVQMNKMAILKYFENNKIKLFF